MARDPRIAVQIAAVDQFSATLAKLKKELAGAGKSVGITNSRLGQIKLPELSIGRARDELTAFHRQAQSQLGNIGRLVPGLGALGAAATVAGVGEMVDRYAQMGTALGRVSTVAGTSAAGMDSLRGATRMLGVSTDTADQSMVGLNKTVADAFYGKNAEAAAMFQQMGIGLTGVGGGAKKAEEVLPRIANFIRDIARVDPRAAVTALERLGISPEMLPLLMRGADGMAALRAEAARLAGITDQGQDASNRYTEAMGRMGIATDRVGRSIMTSLEPHLTPVLTSLSEYIDRHATDIGASFDHIATGIEHMDWKGMRSGIEGAITKLDDWGKAANRVQHSFDWLDVVFNKIRDAGHFVGADKLPGLVADAVNGPSPDTFQQDVYDQLADDVTKRNYMSNPQSRAAMNNAVHPPGGAQPGLNRANPAAGLPVDKQAAARASYQFWVGKGFTPYGAASMAAQEMGESGGDVAARGDGGHSHGLYQHDAARRAAIFAKTGIDLSTETDPNRQREAAYQEMKQRLDAGAGRAFDTVSQTQDLQTGVNSGVDDFERSHDREGDKVIRMRLARDILRLNRDAPPPHAPEPAPEQPDLTRGGRLPQLLAPPPVPASAPSAGGGHGSSARIDVTVAADGLPEWMTVATRAAADGVDMGAIRVRRAMPTGSPDTPRGW